MSDDTEAVGSDNERQVNRRNQIADSMDALRSDELVDIDDAQHDEVTEVDEGEAPIEAKRTIKLKVNGQDVELPEDEVIARAQKVESADRYFQDRKREADEIYAQARKVVPSTDAPAVVTKPFDDEDLALARTLQMGGEEEAAHAIARIRKSGPSVNVDDLTMRAVDRLRFEQDTRWFQEEYSEIFADSNWRDLALLMDEKAIKAGDQRPYRERYAAIGDQVRSWMGKGTSLDAKRERKAATAAPIKQASAVNRQVEDPDEDDDPRSVIGKMARLRGQIIA